MFDLRATTRFSRAMANAYQPPATDLGSGRALFVAQPLTEVVPVLSQAFRLFADNLGAILGVMLPVYVPLRLAQSYLAYFVPGATDALGLTRGAIIIDGVLAAFITPALIFVVVESERRGARAPLGATWGFAARRAGDMFTANLVSGIYAVFGVILLVVPGIYYLLRFAVVAEVVCLDRCRGWSVIRERCFALTDQRMWLLLALFGPVSLIPIGAAVLGGAALGLYDHWLLAAAIDVMSDILFALPTMLGITVYVYARFGESHRGRTTWLEEVPWAVRPEAAVEPAH